MVGRDIGLLVIAFGVVSLIVALLRVCVFGIGIRFTDHDLKAFITAVPAAF